MKKIIIAALALTAMLLTSCENDDILIEDIDTSNPVNVSVTLSDFFSSYNFHDTKHDISIAEEFRTFNSENDLYIQTRVLFYNDRGLLVDSILTYSTNTNEVTKTLKLAGGKYTAVTTLTFAIKPEGNNSYWDLKDKENLNSAYMDASYRWSKWSILSYASQEVTVEKGKTTTIQLKPKPVGALGYAFLQNFQYANQQSKEVSDNKVRRIAVYSQNIATGYKLNPDATDRYIYLDATQTNSWYTLFVAEPNDFDSSWTFFKSNLYGFFHILAPKCNIQFGYILEGESTFNGYGEATYSITTGMTYLAYWDWFKVGNPYFGKADNNHWNTYNAPMHEMPNAEKFLDKSTLMILQNQKLK